MPRTLYLIDGYAQIFRAYYAIRTAMRSPETSEPTNAVFGFTGMLFKLLNQFQPDYVAVAIDVPGRTFRDELYMQYLQLHPANLEFQGLLPAVPEQFPDLRAEGGADSGESDEPSIQPSIQPSTQGRYLEYKGTRQATPDELTLQVSRIFDVIQGFRIPLLGETGLEADDIIATIVQRLLDDPNYADIHVRIISKDKDLEQLLCDRVSIFDVHTDELRDVAALMAGKGITPEQVIDVMALTGDSVDNVPGVEGIGVKTAVQLVREYGDLDGILANLDRIKGKRRENLEKARSFLPLSKALVTLKRDAELPYSLDTVLNAARVSPIDLQQLLPLFQQLGFNRYQESARQLAARTGAPAEPG